MSFQRQRRKDMRNSFDQAQMNDALNNDGDELQDAMERLSKEMRDGFNEIRRALLLAALAFAGSIATYVVNSILQGG